MTTDIWADGTAYESYVGRWSRPVAAQFVRWLSLPAQSAWLDFGCGTGALSQTILALAAPRLVVGCDRASAYVEHAREHARDSRAQFVVCDLPVLPTTDDGFDACVSGLVLNFLPNPKDALAAVGSVVRPGGTVAAYVWDYAEGMELMRVFWDAAVALDPAAGERDEAVRFPLCRPDPLRRLFEDSGLKNVELRAINVPTVFEDFSDYWGPFLGGQGPAPSYAMSLSEERREKLRASVQSLLAVEPDGRIPLAARAWAIRGIR